MAGRMSEADVAIAELQNQLVMISSRAASLAVQLAAARQELATEKANASQPDKEPA
tara:strand:- start:1524 stop:1691 length:168 start_codon:yes stop_codon:yes gene_type:complete